MNYILVFKPQKYFNPIKKHPASFGILYIAIRHFVNFKTVQIRQNTK